MRPSLIISLLLLLSLLILSDQAQGIRLDKGSVLVGQQKSIHMEENIASTKTNNGAIEEAIKDGQFSGNNRKLMISVTLSTTTTTNSKNIEKNGNIKADHELKYSNGEKSTTYDNKSQHLGGGGDDHDHHEDQKSNKHVNSLTTRNRDAKYYPDTVDLAEMDYSPARRKTPIHN